MEVINRTQAEKKWERKKRLYAEQNGLCCYCGKGMILRYRPGDGSGRTGPDEATIEHLFHKFHPRRMNPVKGEKRLALACFQCNIRKGREDAYNLRYQYLKKRASYG